MLLITSGHLPRRLRKRRDQAEDLERDAIESVVRKHVRQLTALEARGWQQLAGTREHRDYRRIRFVTRLRREVPA